MNVLEKEDWIKIQELAAAIFPGKIVGKIQRQGGMTNHTYKVETGDEIYIFRLPGPGTEQLINRQNEKRSAELAAQIGVDAELCYFNADTGIKIVKYIEKAVTMSPESMRIPENIEAAADILHRLHTCGKDTNVPFEFFEMAKNYERIIEGHEVPLWTDYSQVRKQVLKIKDMTERTGKKRVPCHNDPLCENWIRGRDKMYLIDWEYAGMNDAMWDLADLSIEAEYTSEMDEILLKKYFRREVLPEEVFRFQANKIFLDFLWSLWGKARVPFSGDEMEEYGTMRYLRLKKNLEYLK